MKLPTIIDQSRLDQTRPDQNYARSSVKQFLKKHDYFHFFSWCRTKTLHVYLWYHKKKYRYLWENDRTKRNLFASISLQPKPYVIRREVSIVGLFSYFITILGGIAYAHQHGFIPVVDMKNYPNPYLNADETGHINSWEYYFEQPGGISLEQALSSRTYILGRDTALHIWPSINANTFYNRGGILDYWRHICRKYIRFTPAVLQRIERMKAKYSGKKILGVLVRGTDYVVMKPKNHPIPPTAEQAIAKAQQAMQEQNFDAVYLATEDKRIVAKFQEAFGEKLLLPETEFIDYDYDNGKYLAKYINNDKYKQGLDYLVSMLFLAQCNGFIASMTSGSVGVMCLSKGFDYLYVFDLGVYS